MALDFNHCIIGAPSSTEIKNVRMQIDGAPDATSLCWHALAKVAQLRRHVSAGFFLNALPSRPFSKIRFMDL